VKLTDRDVARFHSKVDKTPGQGPHGDCWLWIGGSRGNGYGAFKLAGLTIDAHRVALHLSGTVQPRGMVVMHECDTKKCCNPAHLRLGTTSENMKDAFSRGLVSRNKRETPLTDSELATILDEWERGLSKKVLCRKWNLPATTLTRVIDKARKIAKGAA
jgi:HNH endonuclease/CENP-B N-terminal DNA-binding domain